MTDEVPDRVIKEVLRAVDEAISGADIADAHTKLESYAEEFAAAFIGERRERFLQFCVLDQQRLTLLSSDLTRHVEPSSSVMVRPSTLPNIDWLTGSDA